MTFAVLFSSVETNGLTMVVTAATVVAALSIYIAQCCTLITNYILSALSLFVIT